MEHVMAPMAQLAASVCSGAFFPPMSWASGDGADDPQAADLSAACARTSLAQSVQQKLTGGAGMNQDTVRLRKQWALVRAVLESVVHATVVCDESGTLLVVNRAAEALLRHGDGVGMCREYLHVHDTVARCKMKAILTGAHGNGEHRYVSKTSGAVLVPRPSGAPAYQVILRHLDPGFGLVKTSGTLWSVTITEPVKPSPALMRAITMLYELTPAEARVARHLLNGCTLEEIAASTGVTLNTVRTQLGSVLRKTGARRQAELLRIFFSISCLG